MAFDDRLQCLLLGLAIGFVLGYLARLLREIRGVKEELDEVDSIVKEIKDHDRNDSGFMHIPWVANVAALLVVGLAVYAAFASQKASNSVEDSVTCNRQVLAQVVESLNERSTYSTGMASANIELQQSQADFFAILLHKPPYSELRRSRAVQQYYEDLQTFLVLAKKNRSKVATNPYPTVYDFSACLGKD